MAEGTGNLGGFGIPFTLDPAILLTSAGAINPLRQVARIIPITTREWRGVSSAGVTASYDAEALEVSDDSPTPLAQPTVTAAMGRAFVPFPMELEDDWNGLAAELQRLIADGRDVLDATAYLTGSGTNEPAGVLTGLTTTQRVQTAGAGAFAIADVYSLKQALPARFQPGAAFLAHPNRFDTIFRFVGGNSAEPPLLPTRDGPLVGKPAYEWSTMATPTTTGTKLMLYGNFREGYVIVDRLGMSAEIVPHLFGATNRFPTGQRGLFARWRSGGAVVNANALRYLEAL
jgi:HK97 family phage major capsid protein